MALTNSLYNALPKLSNIQGFWRFEDDFTDESDNSNTLTETSGTIPFTTGKIGKAADFESGDTEYLAIADGSHEGLDITGEISVFGWFKFESISAACHLIGKWNTTGNQRAYAIYYTTTSSHIIACLSPNGATPTYAGGTINTISTGNWYHIGFTLNQDTNKIQIYLNGSTNGGTTSYTGNIYNSTAGFTIGYSSLATGYLDGLADEVIVWNTCLTADEIAEVYAITSEAMYRQISAPTASIGSPMIFIKEALDKGKKYFKKKGLFLPDDRLFKPELGM